MAKRKQDSEAISALAKVFQERFIGLVGDKTQQEAADIIGVTRQTVSNWLSGAFTPDIVAICKIADAFNVSTDYLLGRTNAKPIDNKLQAACEYTGLSEGAIKKISSKWRDEEIMSYNDEMREFIQSNPDTALLSDKEYIVFLSYFLESDEFEEIITDLYNVLHYSILFCEDAQKVMYDLQNGLAHVVADMLKITEDDLFELVIRKLSPFSLIKMSANIENINIDVQRYRTTKVLEKILNIFDRRENLKNYTAKEWQEYFKISDEKLRVLQEKKAGD